jgi:hypothetical protein
MAKTTHILPPQAAEVSRPERRRFPRHPGALAIRSHLVATGFGDLWPKAIHTISAGGISLIVDRPIDPGEVMTLDLYHIPRRFACQLQLHVVSRTEYEGAYLVGGAFTRALTQEELRGLL